MKRLLLFFLLFPLWESMQAQTWQELYAQTDDCWGTNWQQCADILEQALIVAEKEYGQKDSIYALTLNDLGVCFLNLAKYDQSLPLLLRSAEITAEVLGKHSISYGERLTNLGELYRLMGQYEKGVSCARLAVENAEKSLGKSSLEYGIYLNNLGTLLWDMGHFEDALPIVQEALQHAETHLGKKDSYYADRLNNLGLLYRDMGRYEQGLPVLQEALNLVAENPGKDHYSYGISLDNLGQLYQSMGNYEQALYLLTSSRDNFKQSLGVSHPAYGFALSNLGRLHQDMGHHNLGLPLLQQAMDNFEQSLGTSHPQYALSVHNLGLAYQEIEQYQSSQDLLSLALDLTESSLGREHPYFGIREHNLALSLHKLGKDSMALAHYRSVRAHMKQNLGTHHDYYVKALHNMGSLFWEMGMPDSASLLLKEAAELSQQQLSQQFAALNNQFQTSFLRKKQIIFHNLNSFQFQAPQKSDLAGSVYDQQLLLKGFLQNHRMDLLQKLRTHPDPKVQADYAQWESLHKILSRQYQKAIPERLASFDSLKKATDELEIQLISQSQAFKEIRKSVRWQEVLEVLEPGEAAIEFAHFPRYAYGMKTEEVLYVAYLLLADSKAPQMIPLFEEQELIELLSENSDGLDYNALYASRGITPRPKSSNSTNLYKLLWDPIQPILQEVKTIYFSPSGYLNRINLHAIENPKQQYLSDEYNLIQLGSTRSLVIEEKESNLPANQQALLMGGILYQADSAALDSMNPPDINESIPLASTEYFVARGSGDNWHYLTGTEKEVQQIGQLLQEKGFQVDLKMGAMASEEYIRSLPKAPKILHIASHGYFYPDPSQSDQVVFIDQDEKPFERSEHPMLRSGLILSGANYAWAGGKVAEGEEDGILTAYEISRMDLSGTDLVVLSACETGLGDIQGNEGVYGLQRAFKIAGAKYILMSLWQVPDQETQELMTLFYQKWLSGMDIRKAFYDAQKEMRQKYADPYLWAGFVLVE